MWVRIVWQSFARNRGRKLLAAASIVTGTAMVTAMIAVAIAAGDRINREFGAFGANLVVLPAAAALPLEIGGADLRERAGEGLEIASLTRLKTIFWRHNILAYAPYSQAQVAAGANGETVTLVGTWIRRRADLGRGETEVTGAGDLDPSLRVPRQWDDLAAEADAALVGRRVAERLRLAPGDRFSCWRSGAAIELRVAGIIANGDVEENQIQTPIENLWALTGETGRAGKILVTALTNPEDPKIRRDPAAMTPEEYDRWYCTPYPSAIAHQLTEALPGSAARVLHEVADTEGVVLEKLRKMLRWISLAVLAAAILGVASAMSATILERLREVGLMRALGAESWQLLALFGCEALVLGVVGGAGGYLAGFGLAQWIGRLVFGHGIAFNALVVPMAILLGAGIALAGSLLPVRRALAADPVAVLKNG